MSGIAGIARHGEGHLVNRMLDRIQHRGRKERIILDAGSVVLGVVCAGERHSALVAGSKGVQDYSGEGHFARARVVRGALVLERDPLGVAPLYYGFDREHELCFASEVKALLGVVPEIHEMPPGCRFDGRRIESFCEWRPGAEIQAPADAMAAELRERLELSVEECADRGPLGAWLSGGLDSSALVALARPNVGVLHTFAGGLAGSPDLEYAQEVAEFVHSEHHAITVDTRDILSALPEVIAHLESFDSLLVRSSVVNYPVGRMAADHVPAVLSGEGGDELFAGYEYLKALPHDALSDELLDITHRLHNTALQRVDRCASARGVTAHVCFLNPRVVDYALRIPVEYKIRGGIEKWILRQAMDGRLPDRVLTRRKSKFWEGSGVGERLSDHAERTVSDADFAREQRLPDGSTVRSKEELMYYRIFKEHFGDMKNLDWMGRTKRTPEKEPESWPTRTCQGGGYEDHQHHSI